MDYYTSFNRFTLLLEDDIITESLSKVYSFSFEGGDKMTVTYEFRNKSGNTISVDIGSIDSRGVWSVSSQKEVVFSDEDFDVQKMTQSGDALAVINTVAHIMLDFMKRWSKKNNLPPDQITFTYAGTSSHSMHDPNSKRARVYNKIFERVILSKYPNMAIYKWTDASFTLEPEREDESELEVISKG